VQLQREILFARNLFGGGTVSLTHIFSWLVISVMTHF
jgi:hypothetical protein